MTRTLSIVGGGAWGTALACVLSRNFSEVRLWVREPDLAARMAGTRHNDLYLPGVLIPPNVHPTGDLRTAIESTDVVLGVMPSHGVRDLYTQMRPWLKPDTRIVSATKGLEADSLLRVSQVIRAVAGDTHPIAVLSGPTFAREVAASNPTAVVAASDDSGFAREVQTWFSGPAFRVYASTDPVGVEIGGALKNVIAIGAGICDGLGLGHNAVAALITRGLAELTRLAVAAGGKPETLAGLAGLGDLVLTCTGDLSRNRKVGLQLAAGRKLSEILDSTLTVAEGVRTTSVAIQLAAALNVEMPITQEMHTVLDEGRPPAEAIARLMTRSLRDEPETSDARRG